VISIEDTIKKRLKIVIVEDEEDILTLYNDYLSGKGHQVINRYLSTDSIMTDLEKETPDVYLIDYRLPGNKNGIDIAIEILNKIPSAPILFITADEYQHREISKNPIFYDKNIEILLKPVKLDQIESSMLNLVNEN
jgi:DNA-binding NtrC family response regulator